MMFYTDDDQAQQPQDLADTLDAEPNATSIVPSGLTAGQKAQAEMLMTYFENDSPTPQYGFIAELGDGRGFTCGRAGFTTRDGDWYRVVADYTGQQPGNPLAHFLPRLKELADTYSDKVDGLDGMDKAIAVAARDPLFHHIQDQHQDTDSYLPAMVHANELGISSALGKAILYDTALQHGDGDDADGLPALIAATNGKMGGTPLAGIDEHKWIATFLDVRQADLEHSVDVATRHEWAASTDRVAVLRQLTLADDWDLSKPIHIESRDHDFHLSGTQAGADSADIGHADAHHADHGVGVHQDGGVPLLAVDHGHGADWYHA